MARINHCYCGHNAVVGMKYTIGKGVSFQVVCPNCDKAIPWCESEDESVSLWNSRNPMEDISESD